MRAKLVGDPAGLALLDEMQAEHAQIDPILAALDEALWMTAGWDRVGGRSATSRPLLYRTLWLPRYRRRVPAL